MFERTTYKKQAQEQLMGRYTTPVLITLFVLAITIIITCVANRFAPKNQEVEFSLAKLIVPIVVVAVSSILVYGTTYFYLKLANAGPLTTSNDASDADSTYELNFGVFTEGVGYTWLDAILGTLWQSLWVFLWACLFIVPGIVKSIAYSQMKYIIAENNEIGVRNAMNISKVITQGHKGDLFVMYFSFIGWLLLGVLSLGIGLLWILPYINASFANTYIALKNDAIKDGKLTLADFS